MLSLSFNSSKESVKLEAYDASTKRFLGGFRHKLSGVEYHNAVTQTLRDVNISIPNQAPCRFCRETQTNTSKAKYTSTGCESETQTEPPKENGERWLNARTYIPSSYIFDRKHNKSRILQRCWRTYVARIMSKKSIRRLLHLEDEKLFTEKLARQQQFERKEKEIQRRIRPRTRQDFNVLHQEINMWRDSEASTIKNATKLKQDKNLHLDLLYKQVKLLQIVDGLKNTAKGKLKCNRAAATLKRLSTPTNLTLRRSSGFITVYTPLNIKATKLQVLYNGLIKDAPFEVRLDTLEKIRDEAKYFNDPSLMTEFCDLIDRELEMLRRGRPPGALLGLRRRLRSLFYQLIECCGKVA